MCYTHPDMPTQNPQNLTVREAATRLSCTPTTIRRYCGRSVGLFAQAFQLPGGDWRIPASVVEAIESGPCENVESTTPSTETA